MTTTIATCGRSCRTSMCLIVVVPSGGADTIASRLVTWESCSVVARIASSISWREMPMCRRGRSSTAAPPGRRSARLELRLGVADDLVAVLLGDGVDERPPVANLLDGAGHDDLLLRKAHPPELNREALEPAGVVAGGRRVRARDLCHPVE